MSDSTDLYSVGVLAPTDDTICACVVTFNRYRHVQIALERLLNESVDQIVVVDNGSTDGTRDWLNQQAELHERLVTVFTESNLGGAGGFELAMKTADEMFQPDWFLLQDDDAAPTVGAVDVFRKIKLGSDVASVAAAVYTPNGEICEMNRPGLSPFTGARHVLRAVVTGRAALHVDDAAYHRAEVDIECASFVGWFVRGDLVRSQIGYPPGKYFIYADDQTYSFSLRKLGYRNVFVPSIVFEHDTDSRSNAGVISPYWKLFFLYRNTLQFYKLISGPWFALVMLYKVPTWVLRGRRYDRPGVYLRMLGLGLWDGFRGRFDRSLSSVQTTLGKMDAR